MDSLHALERFISYWNDKPEFLIDPFGNATFRALVECRSLDGASGEADSPQSTIVRIRMHGFSKGIIRINKEQDLFSVLPHIDFFPAWQEYRYDDSENALTVSGFSNKMGGRYVVTIVPECRPVYPWGRAPAWVAQAAR